jgi:hypothetical protein
MIRETHYSTHTVFEKLLKDYRLSISFGVDIAFDFRYSLNTFIKKLGIVQWQESKFNA